MKQVFVVPKRHSTFTRCVDALLCAPERRLFQSELKRIVYSKSWRKVVKREIEFWNRMIASVYDHTTFIDFVPARNPRTRRKNEVLLCINPSIEVISKDTHYLLIINGGHQQNDKKENQQTIQETKCRADHRHGLEE